MVRSLGRTLVATVLVAVACRDATMDLFPPPPAPSAGTGAESGAGDTSMGDAGDRAMGGSSGRSGGGTGAAGVGGGCGPGSNCPPLCPPGSPGCPECYTRSDCSKPELPYCAGGRCVECLTNCEPGSSCGCNEDREVCIDFWNQCVPRCSSDAQCTTDERPICDKHRYVCVECLGEDDCKGNAPRTHCSYPNCVECYKSQHCDDGARVCGTDFTCRPCENSFECEGGRVCNRDDGRCVNASPPPPPEPQP